MSEDIRKLAVESGATPEMWDFLNKIRSSVGVSERYKNSIPVATADNIAKISEGMEKYVANYTEFLQELIEVIGVVVMRKKLLYNPLKIFKGQKMEMGATIEEIFVDVISSEPFDMEKASKEIYKITKPNVKARYHTLKRKDTYPQTVTIDDLRGAFTSYGNLESLFTQIITAMYNSAEDDEFTLMKNIVDVAFANDKINAIEIPYIDINSSKETIKTLMKAVKLISNNFTFNSRNYNEAKVKTRSTKEEQYMIYTGEIDAVLDVDLLAASFHKDNANFTGNRLMLDNFSKRTMKLENEEGVEEDVDVAIGVMLIDNTFFMVRDRLVKMTVDTNGRGLYWNYTLHIQQLLSYSNFANATIFYYRLPTE